MTDVKVCVAICNYNHSKYLKQSIQSVVDQTYRNLDITVIDDASSDQEEVKKIISSFDDERLRLICLERNKGKWNALNTAFSSTTADVCTSHDADDVSLPWRIEAQLKTMLETKTVHNLCGFISCWSEEEINEKFNENYNSPTDYRVLTGEALTNTVIYGFDTPGINHYFTGKFETAGVSALFLQRIWDLGIRFNPPNLGLRVLLSEDSDFNFRLTTSLRSTSILAEVPYLYRRNTSTNKEER
jgi:glycosyltransferase involved in cell wall biosynthesis